MSVAQHCTKCQLRYWTHLTKRKKRKRRRATLQIHHHELDSDDRFTGVCKPRPNACVPLHLAVFASGQLFVPLSVACQVSDRLAGSHVLGNTYDFPGFGKVYLQERLQGNSRTAV